MTPTVFRGSLGAMSTSPPTLSPTKSVHSVPWDRQRVGPKKYVSGRTGKKYPTWYSSRNKIPHTPPPAVPAPIITINDDAPLGAALTMSVSWR